MSEKDNDNWINNVRLSLVLLISIPLLIKILNTGYDIYFNVTTFIIALNLIIKYKDLGEAFIWVNRLLMLSAVIIILIAIFQRSFETDFILRILLISTTTILCCFVGYKIGVKLSFRLKLLSKNLSRNNPIS